MRIYFVADTAADTKVHSKYASIISTLNAGGIVVMSNISSPGVVDFSNQDIEKMEETGENMLEKMDALIIEGTQPVAESGYLIALALAHKKPILYLSDKYKAIDKNLFHLQKGKEAATLLTLEYYTEKTISKTLLEFVQKIEKGEGREAPTIKFTLRVTPRIERYLSWKTNNTTLSKADFLRDLLERLIDEDKGFNKFLIKK